MFTDVYRRKAGLRLMWPRWWRAYSYCWQYYAPQGSKLIILELPDGEQLIDIIFGEPHESGGQ